MGSPHSKSEDSTMKNSKFTNKVWGFDEKMGIPHGMAIVTGKLMRNPGIHWENWGCSLWSSKLAGGFPLKKWWCLLNACFVDRCSVINWGEWLASPLIKSQNDVSLHGQIGQIGQKKLENVCRKPCTASRQCMHRHKISSKGQGPLGCSPVLLVCH